MEGVLYHLFLCYFCYKEHHLSSIEPLLPVWQPHDDYQGKDGGNSGERKERVESDGWFNFVLPLICVVYM